MAFISGCTRQDTQDLDKIGKAMYSHVAVTDSHENTSIAADSSVDGNKTDVEVEVEKLSFIAYSVDELVEGVKNAKKLLMKKK